MVDYTKMAASIERLNTVEAGMNALLAGIQEAISDARNQCPTDTTTQNVLDGLQQTLDAHTDTLIAAVKKGTDAAKEKVVTGKTGPGTAPAGSIDQSWGQTSGDAAGNPATDAPGPNNRPFDDPRGPPKNLSDRPASPGNPEIGGNVGSGKTSDQAASAVETFGANPRDDSSMPNVNRPRDTSGPQPADEGKTGPLGG